MALERMAARQMHTDGGGPGPGLRIGVLGPLTVVRNGTKVPTLPEGQRVVLGLLALAY